MRRALACLLLSLGLAACASGEPPEGQLVADPYEQVNRDFHAVNKGLDRAVLRPGSKAYAFLMPALGRHLVSNALTHISLPGVFANQMLQGEFERAGSTLARFTLNSVMGAGGLLDPATEFGTPYRETDFGVTLADWGVEPGVYLELPFLGPSTTRDVVGDVVDMAFKPTTWVGGSDVSLASYGARALDILETRDDYRAPIDTILYDSEDSYRALRTSYILNRRRMIAGETDVEALPDIFAD